MVMQFLSAWKNYNASVKNYVISSKVARYPVSSYLCEVMEHRKFENVIVSGLSNGVATKLSVQSRQHDAAKDADASLHYNTTNAQQLQYYITKLIDSIEKDFVIVNFLY